MEWKKFDLDEKECILEFAESDIYKFQAELIKLEPIFGNHIFGNFDLNVSVFDKKGQSIENFSLNGLNGKFKEALRQLEKLKEKAVERYIIN